MEITGLVETVEDEETGVTYIMDMSEDNTGLLEQLNELPRGLASRYCRENGMSILALSFALRGLSEAFAEATGAVKLINAILDRLPKDDSR